MNGTEAEWVEAMARRLRATTLEGRGALKVETGRRLAYGHEILTCGAQPTTKTPSFQTDLAIIEILSGGAWKPRVVIEAKVASVSTHDAITYSAKAASHRAGYPYLRYGVMLGKRGKSPLPGRLYRHGAQFDFMISFRRLAPTPQELAQFVTLLRAEIRASRVLEKIIYESRKRDRDRYTVLHRKLEVR